jgi:hypothetical protein
MGGLARPAGARPVTNQRSGSRPPIGRRHAPRQPAATRRAAAGSPDLPSDPRTYHMRRTCGTASRPRRSESPPTAASRLRTTRSGLPAPRCRLGGARRWRPRIHSACGKGARTGAGEHPRRALNASACPCCVAGVGRAPGSLFGRSFRRGCATSDDRRRQSEQNRRQDSFPEKSPDHFLGSPSLARQGCCELRFRPCASNVAVLRTARFVAGPSWRRFVFPLLRVVGVDPAFSV